MEKNRALLTVEWNTFNGEHNYLKIKNSGGAAADDVKVYADINDSDYVHINTIPHIQPKCFCNVEFPVPEEFELGTNYIMPVKLQYKDRIGECFKEYSVSSPVRTKKT
jgi:hypothetical protein